MYYNNNYLPPKVYAFGPNESVYRPICSAHPIFRASKPQNDTFCTDNKDNAQFILDVGDALEIGVFSAGEESAHILRTNARFRCEAGAFPVIVR